MMHRYQLRWLQFFRRGCLMSLFWTLTYLLIFISTFTSCKSTGRSKLDTIYFNKGDKSYFVIYENDVFQIYSCKNNSELNAALDAAGDVTKAKELCHDSVTIITPMAMKDAIAEELIGPATDDLIGTKTARLLQLDSQMKLMNLNILQFEDGFINAPTDGVGKIYADEIAKLKAQLEKIGIEVGKLSAALNEPAKLKEIDIDSTLALQSEIANTIDEKAAVFTAMLRDSKLYKLDPTRDNTMMKILDKFPLSCQPDVDTGMRKRVRVGLEIIIYECQPNAEAKIISASCALPGYERIQNYCVFTGKSFTPSKLAATHTGICAISQDKAISCWGEPGKFPMVENSFNEGSTSVGRTMATTNKVASRVVASGRQLCSVNEEGVVIRCWTNVADVPGASAKFSQIVGGDAHFCGINSDKSVTCWGESGYKQTDVPAGLSDVRAISTTENNSCAIDSSNRLACWGDILNSTGASPLVRPSNLGEVNSVSVGTRHVCAILKDSSVQCWGNNDFGQASAPAAVKDAQIIAAGFNESCAVRLNGALQCWGQRTSAHYLQGPILNDVKSIFIGRWGSNFCAVYGPQNSVACWGNTDYSGTINLTPPADLKGVKDIAITASGYACAVTSSNSVRCWGNNTLIPSKVPDALIIKN
ncbi:MAG: hypothetical protein EOP07_03940 [Proteobacteria bacterium]|nr:MAG: hypothetical protein EOP07_03940 [Pseudomonadota bacterium]